MFNDIEAGIFYWSYWPLSNVVTLTSVHMVNLDAAKLTTFLTDYNVTTAVSRDGPSIAMLEKQGFVESSSDDGFVVLVRP